MTVRRVLLMLVSLALGILCLAVLMRIGNINFRLTLRQLQGVSGYAFVKLILLNGLLIYFSTAKWRSVDAVLRRSAGFVPTRITSFAVTSVGQVLGLILPVQFGMTAARTLGMYCYGKPLRRGTAGTLLEQSFDIVIVAFLAFASCITWYYGGGAVTWTLSAAAMIAIALLLIAPLIGLSRRSVFFYGSGTRHDNWILRGICKLQRSNLLDAALARRLILLSAARFCVVVLMAGQTAEAVHIHIPLWKMGAAVPFTVMASIIAVTPGGIGVNELASVTALKLFGIKLTVAAQWSLANRFLGTASCFILAACAIILWAGEKLVTSGICHANIEAEGI